MYLRTSKEGLKALWVIGLNDFSYLQNYLYTLFSLVVCFIIHIKKEKKHRPSSSTLKKNKNRGISFLSTSKFQPLNFRLKFLKS